MCEDERNKELKKECEIVYKAKLKARLDDLFYMAVNAYIDTGKEWKSGDGKLLGFIREYIKDNI